MPSGAVELDTVSEAIEFQRRMNPERPPRRRKRTRAQPLPEAASLDGPPWERLCALLARGECVRMRKIIALVKGRADAGITARELATMLRVESPSVAMGSVAGIARNAKRAGLEPKDIIVFGSDHKYRPGAVLRDNEPPTP